MAVVLIVYVLCLPVTVWASDRDAKIRDAVDAAIRPLMAEHDVPGMAVGVAVDGKVFFFNYGVASKEGNTPVSEDTLFELGSISKTFTATLAFYAQAQGALSLADHPDKTMPQLKGSAINAACLVHLGTYTAGGLPLQFPDEVMDDAMVDYFRQWMPNAAPGTLRQYSNPSIGLLGHITALALKRDFADAMHDLVFTGLGLKHSYIHVPEDAMHRYAWGYDKANQPVRVNPGVFAAEAYGVKSTAADMVRYLQLNMDPGRLRGTMRRALEGTHKGFFDTGDMVQGIGWEQYPYPVTLERLLAGNSASMVADAHAVKPVAAPHAPTAPSFFNKTGSTGGFGAYAAFVPAQKIALVMLANKNYPIPARVTAAHVILAQLATPAR